MNPYKVGVELSIAGNAAAQLSALSTQVLGIHTTATRVENAFGSWATAIAGATAALGAAGLLGAMREVLTAGGELQRQFTNQQLGGFTQGEMTASRSAATDLTRQFPSFSGSHILQMINEARSVYGSVEEALPAMRDALEAATVLQSTLRGNRNVGRVTDAVFNMFKAGDIRNITDDRAQQREFMDQITRAVIATGGRVGPDQVVQAFRYMRNVGLTVDPSFVPVVASRLQEISGMTLGQQVKSLEQALIGGRVSRQSARFMDELGLFGDRSQVDFNSEGEVTRFRPGAVRESELIQRNPYQWVQQVLLPAFERAGYRSQEQQQIAISTLFGNRNAADLGGNFLNARATERDMALMRATMGLSGAGVVQTQDLDAAMTGFSSSWTNLLQALGQPSVIAVVGVLNNLSGAVNDLAKTVSGVDPETLRLFGVGVAVFAAALGGAAVVAFVATVAPLLAGAAIPAAIGGLTIALAALIAIQWDTLAKAVSDAAAAIRSAWNTMSEAFNSMVSGITSIGERIAGAVRSFLSFLNIPIPSQSSAAGAAGRAIGGAAGPGSVLNGGNAGAATGGALSPPALAPPVPGRQSSLESIGRGFAPASGDRPTSVPPVGSRGTQVTGVVTMDGQRVGSIVGNYMAARYASDFSAGAARFDPSADVSPVDAPMMA